MEEALDLSFDRLLMMMMMMVMMIIYIYNPNFAGKEFFKKIALFQLFYLLTSPMRMKKTECSETPAHKFQKPGNNPKERTQHSQHGENFKSRNCISLQRFTK